MLFRDSACYNVCVCVCVCEFSALDLVSQSSGNEHLLLPLPALLPAVREGGREGGRVEGREGGCIVSMGTALLFLQTGQSPQGSSPLQTVAGVRV